jgi:predicted MFS family arabinose efflux permease
LFGSANFSIPALSGFYEDRRGKVLGLHMIGGSTGFGIGPFLGTAIATALNWHMSFIILSLPALCSGLFVALWLRKQGPLNRVSKASLSGGRTSKESGKAPDLAGVLKTVAPMIVLVAVVVLRGSYIFPLLLVDVHHISSASCSWLGLLE